MTQEEILEQFDERYQKSWDLAKRQLNRSALKCAMEAKRLAKTHRLLMPYILSCFSITNISQSLFETDIGIDNAMEIIALVESEEKARKFQNDFDQDHYDYTVHWVSACGYDNLAKHTASKYGYNSPFVHGAVDDGIHVCRRTGKLECVDCFREYATDICLASADYEMGEHHARLCATSTARDNIEQEENRKHIGYRNLVMLSLSQGQLGAALEMLEESFSTASAYHDALDANIVSGVYAERLFWLLGRETELSQYLAEHGLPDGIPAIPSQDENPGLFLMKTINEALILVCEKKPLDAAKMLEQMERYLLARENLHHWFDMRVQRLAALLFAKELGLEFSETEWSRLAEELRHRASHAHQWSAILSLDAMLDGRVRLNPLGIPFPIDLGRFATPGTPKSAAVMQMVLPLVEKTPESQSNTEKPASKEQERTPLEIEAASWYGELDSLWNELEMHRREQEWKGTDLPFPKQEELDRKEAELYEKIMQWTPESKADEQGTPLSDLDFLGLYHQLHRLTLLKNPDYIKEVWNRLQSFQRKFPERGRVLASLAFHALMYRLHAEQVSVEPESLGLPTKSELEQMVSKAFEFDPNRVGVATTAGLIYRTHENSREAQRYFTRACQLDRLNDYATVSLAELYKEGDRPKDAIATIDVYLRAGGRHPGLLWEGMNLAFWNSAAQQFLLYYDLYRQQQDFNPAIETMRIGALVQSEKYDEAEKSLDALDEYLEEPARDRLFAHALCRARSQRDDWRQAFEQALQTREDSPTESLLGNAWDPCEPLWEFVATLPETDSHRIEFEQFLFQRNLVPQSLFIPDRPESEDESDGDDDNTEEIQKDVYLCIVRQPLDPTIQAYAGWKKIPLTDSTYLANWYVIADNETEAMQLALQSQSRCYPLDATAVKCEEVDTIFSDRSQTFIQGIRYPEE